MVRYRNFWPFAHVAGGGWLARVMYSPVSYMEALPV
jgi:hypothetical protein